MVKRIFAVLAAVVALNMFSVSVSAEQENSSCVYTDEETIVTDVSLADDFEPGKVIVVLKKSEEQKSAPRFCVMPPGDRDVLGNTYRFPSYSEQSMFINRKI